MYRAAGYGQKMWSKPDRFFLSGNGEKKFIDNITPLIGGEGSGGEWYV